MQRSIPACTLLVLFAAGGCGESDSPSGYQTPDAAFEAFQKAVTAKDYKTASAALTPESQKMVAGQQVFALTLIAAFDEDASEEITAFLEKNGITEDLQDSGPPEGAEGGGPGAMLGSIGSLVKDPQAFVADAFALMDKVGDSSEDNGFVQGTLGEVSIAENSASAVLVTENGEEQIEFRKGDGGWLIHLPEEQFDMGMAAGDDPDLGGFDDFDFHMDEEDELPPPEAISMEDYDAAWKTSIDVTDKPAIDVLQQMADESGLKVFDQPDLAETLKQPVRVQLDGVSRLEVIENVCQQLGIHPRYQLKTVAFGEGLRSHPATFAGPFLVAVHDFESFAPYPTGRLEFLFFAAGIPTETAAQIIGMNRIAATQGPKIMTLNPGKITGAGKDLLKEDVGGYMRQGSLSTVMFSRSFDLRELLRSVHEIDAISGTISWEFPTAIETLKFAGLAEDSVAEYGDVKLKLTDSELNLNSNSPFRIEVKGTDLNYVKIIGRDGDGDILPTNYSSEMRSDDSQQIVIVFDGQPESLEARLVASSERVTYEFHLPALPLESHDLMPEALTELSIDGDVPLSFEVVDVKGEGDFRELHVKTANHSNKAVHSVLMKLEYLGSDGNVLKDWQSMETGDYVLVDAGANENLELTAFFMPAEAKTARVTAVEIEFADATKWAAQPADE